MSERSEQVPQVLIDEIFLVFRDEFEHKLHSKKKSIEALERRMNRWRQSRLKFYTREEIGRALERTIEEFDWPPSLHDFLKLCEECASDDAEKAFQNACRKAYKGLGS